MASITGKLKDGYKKRMPHDDYSVTLEPVLKGDWLEITLMRSDADEYQKLNLNASDVRFLSTYFRDLWGSDVKRNLVISLLRELNDVELLDVLAKTLEKRAMGGSA